jgi:superfamily II DNA or RNA helicase
MSQVPVPTSLLVDSFDPETVRRGRDYAASGRVVRHHAFRDGEAVVLVGEVEGTRSTPYRVQVVVGRDEHVAGRDRGPVSVYAVCSCPVAVDCKHAVAVILTAMPSAGPPRWESVLRHSLGRLEESRQLATDRVPLGLQVEQRLATYRWQSEPVRHLQLRPVQRGKRGTWVRTGATWSDVVYSMPHRHQHDPEQLAALAEMASALNGTYGQNPDLRRTSPLLWPLLHRAREVGIELVPGAGVTSVELADEPLAVEVDLGGAEDAIDVRFAIRYDDAWWPGPEQDQPDDQPGDQTDDRTDDQTGGRDRARDREVEFLGQPGHGVALVRTVEPRGRRKTPRAELVLAPLTQPAPDHIQELVDSREPLSVPSPDRDRFLGEYLPRLRRQLPVASRDESLDIPAEVPPRLVLSISWLAAHEIETSWWWRYGEAGVDGVGGAQDGAQDGAQGGRWYAVDTDDGLSTVRNRIAEQAVLDELDLARRTPALAIERSGRPEACQAWSGRELLVFVNRVLPAIRESGLVDVEETGEQPDYREATSAPEVFFDLRPGAGASDRVDEETTDWLDLAVRITVDDEEVPLATVLACLTLGSDLVFTPSGRHVPADHPAFEKLAELVAAAGQLIDQPPDGVRVGRQDLSLWAELAELGVVDEQAAQWVEAARSLRDLERLPEVAPAGLKSELRPYQRSGLSWLAFLWQSGLGGILADDMGLGKTLQALALVAHARESGAAPFLVVAPTSVVGAWAHEAVTHAPGLVVRTVSASAARREESIADLYAVADVVVTSYTLFRIEAEAYAAEAWGGLILDEAQNIKNHQGRTYQSVRKMDVPFRLALTGTPFENRLMELWSLLSVTAPGLYPWPKQFKRLVAGPVERAGDAAALERFRRRIRPFLLRRTKELVAADLPPKQEQVLDVELNGKHRRIYDTHLQRERQTVLGLVDDFEHNRIAIFRALTRLRMLSLDAALLDAEHAAVGSAKLDALVEHLHELISEGHRALVFSQFTSYLARVCDRLTAQGIEFSYLDGRTRDRTDVIEGFRSGEAPVFVISLKAGGVGLTLTEADYVFLLDPWWNPAVEAQAVDRTHRIGQRRSVMVYRLVATDTIEEKVMELKERKAALFAQVIDGDGAMAADITADDVRAIFEP